MQSWEHLLRWFLHAAHRLMPGLAPAAASVFELVDMI
jgi:hypothetical protein